MASESSRSQSLVIGLAVGIVLGSSVVWLALSDSSDAARAIPDDPSTARNATESGELAAELREIRTLLATHLVGAGHPRRGPSESAPVRLEADPIPELTMAIRDLVAALPASMSAGSGSLLAGIAAEARPTDHDAVAEIRSAMAINTTSMRPDLFGLSPSEIYRRFGTPSSVDTYDNSVVVWVYKNPDDTKDRLEVRFVSGYVTYVRHRY